MTSQKKLAIILLLIVAVLCAQMLACKAEDETAPKETEDVVPTAAEEQADTVFDGENIVLAKNGATQFKLVYGTTEMIDSLCTSNIMRISNAFQYVCGANLETFAECDAEKPYKYEIQVGAIIREKCFAQTKTLTTGQYAMHVYADKEADTVEICISHDGKGALLCAIERFIETYITAEGTLIIPQNASFEGSCNMDDHLIVAENIIADQDMNLRDPCVIVEDGTYYVYGTGWQAYRNTTGSLASGWEHLGCVVEVPADCIGDWWAPEVHKYGDKYYMFTTYRSSKNDHRGCAIFVSDSPEGPFVLHSDGHITPSDWDSIDGTFYIDADGNPWIVFVHEWTSTEDGVGRMAAARLSADLKECITEPVELFRADDPEWADGDITDGCFMYTLSDGTLCMIWSNYDKSGYVTTLARSSNGKIDGEWTQYERLFCKSLMGTYDGGHSMIFTGLDGELYMSAHSPNDSKYDRPETPVFIKIQEECGFITLNLWEKP